MIASAEMATPDPYHRRSMTETHPKKLTSRLPRRLLKTLVPKPVRQWRVRFTAARHRRRFRDLSVAESFERVYAEGWWGQNDDFDSGDGSDVARTDLYVTVIREFIEKRNIRSVIDLGCGDFRVGQRIVSPGMEYVGIDVVQALVNRNNKRFGAPQILFEQRDLIKDVLPKGELALLRQVLQHLSNAQIEIVLRNASHYPYLIVTEHLPVGDDVIPNVDKPHGPDIRMPERSGVFLESPPFSRNGVTLLEVPYAANQVLRTTLLEN